MGGATKFIGVGCGTVSGSVREQVAMAERQQRQRLRTLRNNRQLARFVVDGRATGKQLGTGSYGSVEEVGVGASY